MSQSSNLTSSASFAKFTAVIVHPSGKHRKVFFPLSAPRLARLPLGSSHDSATWPFFTPSPYLSASYPESTPHDRDYRKTQSPSRLSAHAYSRPGSCVARMCSVVTRGELGLHPADQPKASVLFLGPTGVGKTELTKHIAKFIFGKELLYRSTCASFCTSTR